MEALRLIGAVVVDTHTIGRGYPDLTVSYNGKTILLEVKCGNGRLTKAEREFKDSWKGLYAVVRTPEEAIEMVRFLL